MTGTDSTSETEHRCLRPGCGRKLTSAESIARGFGPVCFRKVRSAQAEADLSAWTASQLDDAREALEDGAVVPSTRADVFHVVSKDGSEVHLTHPCGCNCTAGLKTGHPRPCWHRAAVAIVLGSLAPVPARRPLTLAA
jgi:hypothetical protein